MSDRDQISLREALRSAIWAKELTPEQMARVEADTFETFVLQGGYVCCKGEMVENWLAIIDGVVKMNNFSSNGKSVTFIGVPPGGWFGEGTVLKNEVLKYDAMALRDSRIARMPAATLMWLLDNSLPFSRFLLMQLNERLGQFIGMVENDRLLNPDTRVARCLASLYHAHLYPSLEKIVHISQEELGLLSGASRQRANQALQLWRNTACLAWITAGSASWIWRAYGVMRLSGFFLPKSC